MPWLNNYLGINQLQLREQSANFGNNTAHQINPDKILHPSALGSGMAWQQKLQQSIGEK
jgi:hypothetical protein